MMIQQQTFCEIVYKPLQQKNEVRKCEEFIRQRIQKKRWNKKRTFERMLNIISVAYAKKHERRGRKPKLSLEDQLLAALEYWREYRTYARIALDFGIDESNMYRGILWIENVLIKDGTFSLPGKKKLLKDEMKYEIIAIDATETTIERPKKILLWEEKTTYIKNYKLQLIRKQKSLFVLLLVQEKLTILIYLKDQNYP